MGRDLLYKPPVPMPPPDETGEGASQQKPPVRGRSSPHSRELGSVGSEAQRPAAAPASSDKPPAFKAAYFNQDTSGIGQVNLRQRNAQALRGSEGATDLKRIVLPPAGVDSPDPVRLQGVSERMGLDGGLEPSLESLLGRQSAWAKGREGTLESIQARRAQLERMIEDRKEALRRLALSPEPKATSVTVKQAADQEGRALAAHDRLEDVVSAGRDLIARTLSQAEGMHRRIAKMLGIKR